MLGSAKKLIAAEGAATAIEYGFIAALIALACVAAFAALGTSVSAIFTNIRGSM